MPVLSDALSEALELSVLSLGERLLRSQRADSAPSDLGSLELLYATDIPDPGGQDQVPGLSNHIHRGLDDVRNSLSQK